MVLAYSRDDVSTNGFWKRVTTMMFDVQIIDINAGSYLCITPKKALGKVKKKNKE